MNTDENAPQTVVVSRRVLPGCEKEFERLSAEMTREAVVFPGHMGANMFRPASKDDPEYRVIFKFEDAESLDIWLTSDVRRTYVQKIEALLEEPSKVETLSSIVTWFTLSGKSAVKPPARYKMAFVSWLALFPIVTAIFMALGPWLERIHLVPRVGMVTAVVIVLMTWVAMPWLTKLFSRWLYPSEDLFR